MMLGDKVCAGIRNCYHLEAAVQRDYGYRHMVPTHQGRGAENLLSKIPIKPGDHGPGNLYFISTRLPQELAEGTFHDVIVDEAHDATRVLPFKGKLDLAKLAALVDEVGAEEARNLMVVYEGQHTYGGLAGRDMEALARGTEESVHPRFFQARFERL